MLGVLWAALTHNSRGSFSCSLLSFLLGSYSVWFPRTFSDIFTPSSSPEPSPHLPRLYFQMTAFTLPCSLPCSGPLCFSCFLQFTLGYVLMSGDLELGASNERGLFLVFIFFIMRSTMWSRVVYLPTHTWYVLKICLLKHKASDFSAKLASAVW